jgi:uncharacterized protein YlxP (DUF503 family)
MAVGVLTLQLQIPGCASLKEKRSRLKPFIARLHREFNISVAEVDSQDIWQQAVIACAMVSNDHVHIERALQHIAHWIEATWPDIIIFSEEIEII